MNYEDYEREVARRFAHLRRAARRRALDRVKEIACGLATTAMVVALMYAIAKYTTSRGAGLTRTADGGQLKQGE